MKIKITAAILMSMLFTISCTDLSEDLYDKVEDGDFGNTSKRN